MNPYQVVGGIAFCVLMFTGVVTFLSVQGVPVPLAFLGVYLAAVWCMIGMQRRARESYGCMEQPRRRHLESSLRESNVVYESHRFRREGRTTDARRDRSKASKTLNA